MDTRTILIPKNNVLQRNLQDIVFYPAGAGRSKEHILEFIVESNRTQQYNSKMRSEYRG